MDGDDADAIKAKTEALAAGVDEARRGHVQGAAGRAAPAPVRAATAAPGWRRCRRRARRSGSDEKVVDADFEEVDEQKKGGCA